MMKKQNSESSVLPWAILWTFVAILSLFGWIFTDYGQYLAFLGAVAVGFISVNFENWRAVKAKQVGQENACFALVIGSIMCIACGTGHPFIGSLIVFFCGIFFITDDADWNVRKTAAVYWGIVVLGGFIYSVHDKFNEQECRYDKNAKRNHTVYTALQQQSEIYNRHVKELLNLQYFPRHFVTPLHNPYRAFKNDSAKKWLDNVLAEHDAVKHSRDSLLKLIKQEWDEELAPYKGEYAEKVETLRVKRVWMNGDVIPWTYEAWTRISVHFRRFGGSINISGKADFVGNQQLDYVNIVFEDNSFLKVQIKDHPDFLIIRSGERVIRWYEAKKEKTPLEMIGATNDNRVSLLFDKKYKPLF